MKIARSQTKEQYDKLPPEEKKKVDEMEVFIDFLKKIYHVMLNWEEAFKRADDQNRIVREVLVL